MNGGPLNIEHFAKLLQSCCPDSHLWLYASGGRLVWLNGENAAQAPPGTLDLSDWQQDAGDLLWSGDDARQLLAWPVLDEQRDASHYLIVSSAADASDRHDLYASAAPVLEAAAQSLGNELYMSNQLNSMARELAVRYEELNLVYYTDDEVRFLDEGRQALHSLVQNCNDYLSVESTALLMPDQGIGVIRKRGPDDERQTPIPPFQEKLIGILQFKSRTIVVNEPAEAEDLIGASCKLIASPINDGSGKVAGVLLILRAAVAPDFENSDRNLLVVMAGKASKIIQSSYDSLTGLMRQEGFERSLSSALSHARHSDSRHCLLHLNIDRMHLINDTLGYQFGDRAIQAIASLLRSKLRESDRIARLGGDEFGILLHKCTTEQGRLVAEKLCTAVEKLEIEVEDKTVDVTVCIGVAVLDKTVGSVIDAQAGAEIACSVAKELGRNRWHHYDRDDPSLQARRQHMEWVSLLKDALDKDQFELYCQRIVPLRSATPGHHFEILVRMLDDQGAIVPPAMFLPVAERYQMMPAIDRWIVERTLARLSDCHEELAAARISCSINLSGQTVVDADFIGFVTGQFELSGVPPSLVCFEITETAAIANLDDAQRFMHALRNLGCRFALDDFGAGLSSFAYLRSLPVDYLKFDGTFVKPIAEDATAAAMLAAMNQIGKIVGLETIAEFVETPAIMDQLRAMGVDFAQGYGVGRPRPLDEELAGLTVAAIPA